MHPACMHTISPQSIVTNMQSLSTIGSHRKGGNTESTMAAVAALDLNRCRLPQQLAASNFSHSDTPASCWPLAATLTANSDSVSRQRSGQLGTARSPAHTLSLRTRRLVQKRARNAAQQQAVATHASLDASAARQRGATLRNRPAVVADPVTIVDWIDADKQMMASPSIVRLQSGRLLVVHEQVPRHGTRAAASTKRVCSICLHTLSFCLTVAGLRSCMAAEATSLSVVCRQSIKQHTMYCTMMACVLLLPAATSCTGTHAGDGI